MTWQDNIQVDVKHLLKSEYPVKFYWNRDEFIDYPYVVYQTEDLEHGLGSAYEKLAPRYKALLDNAAAIYEYSEANFQFSPYADRSIFKPLLPNLESSYHSNKTDIDILFYGTMSERRKSIIRKLSEKFNVHCIIDLDLKTQKALMMRSKWILSVGVMNNIHNDLIRVAPALNAGCNIMLEQTQEIWYNEYMQKHFADRICYIPDTLIENF